MTDHSHSDAHHHQRDHQHEPHASTAGTAHGGRPDDHDSGSVNVMAASATLHCLTGCAIGEIMGLMIGTAAGWVNGVTIAVSIALAFFFGYLLSTLPLLKAGLAVGAALKIVLAADTVSIATMEIVDNLVMIIIPGAMDAGLVNVIFWVGMMIAFTAAFVAAYPVNRVLLQRGKGHALTHGYHNATGVGGARRFIPSFSTSALVAALAAFMVGGLVVSIAAGSGDTEDTHSAPSRTINTPPAADR